MLIFDVACVKEKFKTTYAVALWDETDIKREKIRYFGPYLSLQGISIRIFNQFKEHFPSMDQLREELIAINNYNICMKKNSFGFAYPMEK